MSRYRFNNEKLEFTKERPTFAQILRKGMWIFLGSVVLAFVYYLIFGLFVLSPAERNLARETELMNNEYKRLSQKMEGLDKVLDELEERDKSIYATVLHSAPIDMGVEEANLTQYQNMVDQPHFALVFHNDSVISRLEHKAAAITRELFATEELFYAQADSLKGLPACFPLQNPTISNMGATLGKRIQPFYKIPMEHNGMDFLSGLGTDVLATADGKVVEVKRSPRGQGNTVKIEHSYGGYQTLYAHLSDIFVRQGQQVMRGMVIARVGSTGMSFTPHLHYEVRREGTICDPVHYYWMNVMPDQYRQIMLTAYNTGQSLD